MAAAKKNTKKRAVAAPKVKSWVVPVEATVTGYIITKAHDEEVAIEQVDNLLEAKKIDLLSGKTLDLDDFTQMISRGEVSGALAMEDVVESKVRAPAKKKATTTAKKTTKKTPAKGRTRGAAKAKATNPSTGKKAPAKKKAAATTAAKTSTAKKGRSRGGKR